MENKRKSKMMTADFSPERVNAFSDGVFAIIITIMILELKRPEQPTFAALFASWPTWISYAVSYMFIAIVWINHHYLLRHSETTSLRLLWANFTHLFSVSLIPFLTDWIAETRLASVPVMLYAFAFLLVNITYMWLYWETLCTQLEMKTANKARRLFHIRSVVTLIMFLTAMIIAIWLPFAGFAIVFGCLLLYIRPGIPGMKMQ